MFSFLLKMELWEDWDKSDVVIRSEQNDEKVFWFFWDKQTAIKRFGGDEHGAKKVFFFPELRKHKSLNFLSGFLIDFVVDTDVVVDIDVCRRRRRCWEEYQILISTS